MHTILLDINPHINSETHHTTIKFVGWLYNKYMIHDIGIYNYITPRPVAHPTSYSRMEGGRRGRMNLGGKKRRIRCGRRDLVSSLCLYIVIDTPMYAEYRKNLDTWMAIQEKVKTPRKLLQANQTIVGGL